MGVESQWDWKSLLHDLVLEPRPDEENEKSWLAHQKFARHSFLRFHVREEEEALELRLEVALGPPPHDPEDLGRHLVAHLGLDDALSWKANLAEIPWELSAQVPTDSESARAQFQGALRAILKLSDQMDQVDHPSGWYSYLAPPEREQPANSPFEAIGASSPATAPDESAGSPDGGATIVAGATSRVEQDILLSLGIAEELSFSSLERLQEGLKDYLRTQHDATAVLLEDPPDRPELRLPAAARTRVDLRLTPWADDEPRALQDRVDRFITRIKEFTSRGVDLFVYLGVADVVLPSEGPTRRSRERDDGVVFSFGGSTEPHSHSGHSGHSHSDHSEEPIRPANTLVPGDLTDPRLRREDAEGALVDLVLRHPGYSDRRISQVLSLLFEIEYVDAVRLAERAPCVLARGVGRDRAASFKQVIESAGGKVVLVEPGTFAEV